MPRPSNSDERRAQITRGLLKVMASKGYEGATVQDIAKAARLTAGLVHYHFDSKQAVLEALLDELTHSHLGRLQTALEQAGDDPEARLEAFIDQHLATGATADPQSLAVWVALGGEALRSKIVQERYRAVLAQSRDVLAGIITDGQRAGRFAKGEVEASAAALLAVIEGYFVLAATARDLIPHASAAKCARRMASGLLRRSS